MDGDPILILKKLGVNSNYLFKQCLLCQLHGGKIEKSEILTMHEENSKNNHLITS